MTSHTFFGRRSGRTHSHLPHRIFDLYDSKGDEHLTCLSSLWRPHPRSSRPPWLCSSPEYPASSHSHGRITARLSSVAPSFRAKDLSLNPARREHLQKSIGRLTRVPNLEVRCQTKRLRLGCQSRERIYHRL